MFPDLENSICISIPWRMLNMVGEYAAGFAESWIRPRLHEPVFARLTEHLTAGHRVIVVRQPGCTSERWAGCSELTKCFAHGSAGQSLRGTAHSTAPTAKVKTRAAPAPSGTRHVARGVVRLRRFVLRPAGAAAGGLPTAFLSGVVVR